MEVPYCRYCMDEITAADQEVSFPFSDEYVFHFHPHWYCLLFIYKLLVMRSIRKSVKSLKLLYITLTIIHIK